MPWHTRYASDGGSALAYYVRYSGPRRLELAPSRWSPRIDDCRPGCGYTVNLEAT